MSNLASRIVMMENHNNAYNAWRKAQVKEKILVHLDAHLDLAAIPDKNSNKILESKSLEELEKLLFSASGWNFTNRTEEELIHIGNFIYPALKNGFIREIWWVIPDADWGKPKHRSALKKILKFLPGADSVERERIEVRDGRLHTCLYGKPLIVCNLDNLGSFSEDILLDIDVDFMVIPSINSSLRQERVVEHNPWISPGELVGKLFGKGIKPYLTTISYSVEGGFTPLSCKYLGDVLGVLLLGNSKSDIISEADPPQAGMRPPQFYESKTNAGASSSLDIPLEVIDFQREADVFRRRGLYDEAIQLYEKALKIKPDTASIRYSLSLCYWEKGNFEAASSAYKKAIQSDPTYRTVFNNFGWKFKELGKWNEAMTEYKKIVSLDPEDPFAYCGIGDVYFQKKKYREARNAYGKSIELKPGYVPAHIGLARTYEKLKLSDEAIKEYEKAVELDGMVPFALARLGFMYAKTEETDRAISSLKKAINLGFPSVGTFFLLGSLYLKKKMFFKSAEQYRRVTKIFPRFFLASLRIFFAGLIKRIALCFP